MGEQPSIAQLSSPEELAEFQRVSGILCAYLLALRRWQKATNSKIVDEALVDVLRAEGLVFGLLDELHALPFSSQFLIPFFVKDMCHTGEALWIPR
jgi:hypothetical protein